jgi:F-type H+-transporting ATPase subunit b
MEIIPDPVHVALLTIPFAVAALAVHLILWRPLLAWLDERDHTSAHAREEAARLDTQAADQLSRIEARLADARAHVGALRAEARERAHAQEARIVAQARSEADGRIDTALERIRTDRATASATLRTTAIELAQDIASRVLGRRVA